MLKYKKLFIIIGSITSIIIIAIIILSILGAKERTGYLTEFKLKESSDNTYTYNMRINSHDKIFRNSDIYGIYPNDDTLPEYIISISWANSGSPFGNLISNKEIVDEKIDGISYTVKVRFMIYMSLFLIYSIITVILLNKLYPNILPKKNKIELLKIKYISKTVILIITIIFLSVFMLSFLSPLVYDDIGYSLTTSTKIGVIDYITTALAPSLENSIQYYKCMHGRPATPMHTFFIHLPILWGIFISSILIILYIFVPFIIYYKRLPSKKEDSYFILFSIAMMLGYSLLFSHQAWILNDFFLRTISNGYIVPMAFFLLLLIPIWKFYMEQSLSTGSKYLDNNYYKSIILFLLAFLNSTHNEFTTLYGIGLILGIIFLSIVKERQLKPRIKIPHHLWNLYAGLAIGGIITIFAPGVISRKTWDPNASHINALKLIYKDMHYALIPLLIALVVIITLTLLISKYNKPLKEKVKQKVWVSVYCFCCFLGWALIVILAKLPYIRVLIIAQGILPLLYLLILWTWLLIDNLPKTFIKQIVSVCSVLIIILSFYAAWHNIRVMTAIQWKLRDDITISNEKSIPLVVIPYQATFKNAYYKKNESYATTSELGNGFSGTIEEYQKYGGRLLFHIPTIESYRGPDSWSPFLNILSWYEFTGEVDIEESKKAKPRVIDEYPTFLEILSERLKSII